jgi:hypothetical protein
LIREFHEPDLHDATITSIAILGEDTLEIRCVLDGATVTMRVERVIDLRADDFLRQNVISSVHLYSGNDCPDHLLKYLSQGVPARTRSLATSLEQGVGKVLRVEAAIGCRVVTYFLGELRATVETA